jgi:hypothetical protein
MSNLQINQFQQVPVLGQVEMEPLQTGVLSCQVSPNQATSILAGYRVTLDTTITNGPGKVPQIISLAGATTQSLGVMIHSAKQDTFNALDMCEVAYFGGPIVWLMNTAVAITPFQVCEDNGSNLMQAYTSNKKVAVALDYIPASTLGRYILLGIAASAL